MWKTTLFRLLLGSIPHSSGTIKINGRSTQDMSQKELANQIAYIPQYHSPIFDYSVLDIVIMGRASHFSSFDKPKAIDREAAFDALERFTLSLLPTETMPPSAEARDS